VRQPKQFRRVPMYSLASLLLVVKESAVRSRPQRSLKVMMSLYRRVSMSVPSALAWLQPQVTQHVATGVVNPVMISFAIGLQS
jgi:hypothetical protein